MRNLSDCFGSLFETVFNSVPRERGFALWTLLIRIVSWEVFIKKGAYKSTLEPLAWCYSIFCMGPVLFPIGYEDPNPRASCDWKTIARRSLVLYLPPLLSSLTLSVSLCLSLSLSLPISLLSVWLCRPLSVSAGFCLYLSIYGPVGRMTSIRWHL